MRYNSTSAPLTRVNKSRSEVRGRPRKWPSETARREHEAAKRRLRNKLNLAAEEFDDVRRLTALADELQRQVVELTEEVEALRWRERDLERRARAAPHADCRIRPVADRCERHRRHLCRG